MFKSVLDFCSTIAGAFVLIVVFFVFMALIYAGFVQFIKKVRSPRKRKLPRINFNNVSNEALHLEEPLHIAQKDKDYIYNITRIL